MCVGSDPEIMCVDLSIFPFFAVNGHDHVHVPSIMEKIKECLFCFVVQEIQCAHSQIVVDLNVSMSE